MRYCLVPGCPALLEDGRRRCARHARERERERPNLEARKWYHTARWRDLRLQVLRANPLCVHCMLINVATPAVDIDHIRPHGGDENTFFTLANLQPLCKLHHFEKTRRGQ